MSKGKILVTDTLFVYDEHVKKLEAAGYEVIRCEKPDSTEKELCELVKGKIGYLQGGIEKITDKVVDAADQLKVISVAAVGYEYFIPGWAHALEKGVTITYTPDGPTHEVAEWAIAACLLMNREFLDLGLVGEKQFATTKGIEAQNVGIIGLGRIGSAISEMLKPFRPASISYYAKHRHEDKERVLGVKYLELMELLNSCDIVFLCVSDDAKNLVNAEELQAMKKDALLINTSHAGVIDEKALLNMLQKRTIRAISDHPMTPAGFSALPYSHWYCNKTSNTITKSGAKLMSDTITNSMLNILDGKDDKYVVKKDGL
jgi:phosphoglycerate dehydrogenase-like enzyme